MKKIVLSLATIVILFASCQSEDDPTTNDVNGELNQTVPTLVSATINNGIATGNNFNGGYTFYYHSNGLRDYTIYDRESPTTISSPEITTIKDSIVYNYVDGIINAIDIYTSGTFSIDGALSNTYTFKKLGSNSYEVTKDSKQQSIVNLSEINELGSFNDLNISEFQSVEFDLGDGSLKMVIETKEDLYVLSEKMYINDHFISEKVFEYNEDNNVINTRTLLPNTPRNTILTPNLDKEELIVMDSRSYTSWDEGKYRDPLLQFPYGADWIIYEALGLTVSKNNPTAIAVNTITIDEYLDSLPDIEDQHQNVSDINSSPMTIPVPEVDASATNNSFEITMEYNSYGQIESIGASTYSYQ